MTMKYFIDFDDTLFDRKKFWDALIEIMEKYGLAREFDETYHHPDLYDKKKGGYEGTKPHLELLRKRRAAGGGDTAVFELIGQEIDQLFDRAPEFLFPKAISFLEAIDRNKCEVKILTVGGPAFQKSKVRGSGIEALVGEENVIYAIEAKEDVFAQLIKEGQMDPDEPFILLEDKIETIKAVEGQFRQARVIQAVNGSLMEHVDPSQEFQLEEKLAVS